MTVYGLIQELTKFAPDKEVRFYFNGTLGFVFNDSEVQEINNKRYIEKEVSDTFTYNDIERYDDSPQINLIY